MVDARDLKSLVPQGSSEFKSRVPDHFDKSEFSAVWLAHLVWDQGVESSNLSTPTIFERWVSGLNHLIANEAKATSTSSNLALSAIMGLSL